MVLSSGNHPVCKVVSWPLQSRQELNVLGVSTGGETVPVSSIIPHLQNLMHHAAVQQVGTLVWDLCPMQRKDGTWV
jgi:hypothetical protein